ncbi:MAG: DUF4386 domain-containing protein [Cyclobacteriaceae bacterium]|nr:DUF4386 domain-containing protein [Cyclobacteriaceae bacterium]
MKDTRHKMKESLSRKLGQAQFPSLPGRSGYAVSLNNHQGLSLKQAAVIAGLGLLLMALIAPFSYFQVVEGLIVPGDAAATAVNVSSSANALRWAIVGFLIIIILDVLVAWALYVFLRPVNKMLSLLAAWFRVIYAALFAVALNDLFGVLHLVGNTGLADFPVHGQMMLFLQNFQSGWDLSLFVFGVHLLLLGVLMYQSGYMPKILASLVVLAGIGYGVDSIGKTLWATYTLDLAIYTFPGEVLLIFWLLIKGRKFEL